MPLPDLTALDDETRATIEKMFADVDARITDDDAVEAVAKAQAVEIETLRKNLADEVGKRRLSEMVAVAKSFEPLLGKADDMAPVLAEIAEKAPEAWAKLSGPLTAAVQRKDLAKLFSEVGTSGDGEADPIAKRDAYVAAHPELAPAVARAAFWKANPEAKKESRS